jgi:hypothetical protein
VAEPRGRSPTSPAATSGAATAGGSGGGGENKVNEGRQAAGHPGPCELLLELSRLLEALAGAGEEFLLARSGGIARLLSELRLEVEAALAEWGSLPAEERLREALEALPWRGMRSGRGEYCPVRAARALAEAVGRAGRLEVGGYAYVLARSGRYLLRFKRRGGGRG